MHISITRKAKGDGTSCVAPAAKTWRDLETLHGKIGRMRPDILVLGLLRRMILSMQRFDLTSKVLVGFEDLSPMTEPLIGLSQQQGAKLGHSLDETARVR